MNKHEHGKLTLEKNILPLLPRIKPATFRSRVLLSTTGPPIPPSMLGTIRWLDGGGRGMVGGWGGYVPSRKSAKAGFIQSDERI